MEIPNKGYGHCRRVVEDEQVQYYSTGLVRTVPIKSQSTKLAVGI